MSIFDVIRYPLSDPPTVEELDNLSVQLRGQLLKYYTDRWPHASDISTDNWQPVRIHTTLRVDKSHSIILKLRKYIREL